MILSNVVFEAQSLRDFFENVGKAAFGFQTKLANNPVGALEIVSNSNTFVTSSKFSRNSSQKFNFFNFATFGESLKVIQRG